jgi:phenylalanine-4-hydroxylase
LIIAFTDCTVKLRDKILFDPSWGVFDMVCGKKVRSVFGGAADRKEYLSVTGGFNQEPGKPKTNLTAQNQDLNELYRKVRELREKKVRGDQLLAAFEGMSAELEKYSPDDWLLRYEMLEMTKGLPALKSFSDKTQARLEQLSKKDVRSGLVAELIQRGLEVL